MQFRLRTLLIVLALGPPLIALEWWYWEKSIFPLLVLIVVGRYLILWVFERTYDALRQLIGGKPRGVTADDSN